MKPFNRKRSILDFMKMPVQKTSALQFGYGLFCAFVVTGTALDLRGSKAAVETEASVDKQEYLQDLSLIKRPPFQVRASREITTVRSNVPTEGSINQQFELSGIFDIGQVTKFSIQDKTKNGESRWISLGETWNGLEVESFDATTKGVVVSMGSRTEMLKLRKMEEHSGVGIRSRSLNNASNASNRVFPQPPPPPPKASKLLEQLRNRKN